MENEDMKNCPFCAEMIKAEAIKCRWCGSRLPAKGAESVERIPAGNYWGRVDEGKRIAGVCTGLAREFNAPKLILPLRLFFILTTVFYGFGLILYIALWLLMPAPAYIPGKQKAETLPDGPAGRQIIRPRQMARGYQQLPRAVFPGWRVGRTGQLPWHRATWHSDLHQESKSGPRGLQ